VRSEVAGESARPVHLSMSGSTGDLASRLREHNAGLVRRALLLLGMATVVVIGGSWVAGGVDGLLGALIGTAMVGAFFGVDVVVMRRTSELPPLTVMAIVVMEYTFKITLLAVFLAALRGTTAFSETTFAVAVIALTSVVLIVAVVLVGRWKRLYVEPSQEPPSSGGDPPT